MLDLPQYVLDLQLHHLPDLKQLFHHPVLQLLHYPVLQLFPHTVLQLFNHPDLQWLHHPVLHLFHQFVLQLFHQFVLQLFHHPVLQLLHHPVLQLFHHPVLQLLLMNFPAVRLDGHYTAAANGLPHPRDDSYRALLMGWCCMTMIDSQWASLCAWWWWWCSTFACMQLVKYSMLLILWKQHLNSCCRLTDWLLWCL